MTAEVYTSFVDTFFSDSRSLLTGALIQAMVIAAAGFDTGHSIYFALVIAILIVGALRFRQMKAYYRDRELADLLGPDDKVEWASQWETRFLWQAGAATGLIGLYSFIALQVAPSEYAIVSSTMLVLGTLPSVVGRIYGSDRLAGVIVIALLLPLALGLLLRGDAAHILLTILCIPYLALTRTLVRDVRHAVLDAIQGRWKNQEIAERFDIALNNMSHGLIMFDSDLRVVVANSAARALFNLPAVTPLEGHSFKALLRYGRTKGVLTENHSKKLAQQLLPMLADGGTKRFVLADGRHMEFKAIPPSKSGAVLTFEDITERIKAEKQMVDMARYDALTGLPNRGYFATLIEDRLRHKSDTGECALLMLDVDDFKHVNDTLGHSQGDALLREVADRLKRFRKQSMLVSRQGGDEFMVFMSDLSREKATQLAEALRAKLTGVYRLGGEQVHVATSIGIVVTDRKDFDLTRTMVKADLALYRSKALGKRMSTVFEESMDAEYRRRQYLKNELEKAVDEDQLRVRYQPIVDATTGKLVACEALSRWSHAELGDVSPAEYIPLAEEMGIIGKISRAVLNNAMRDCASWPDQINVSINLSAIDFRRSKLMDEIKQALEASALDPSRVEIEVTETAVISNEQEMLASLNAIRNHGIKISLDDFGTGYSSLSYLHRLPLDKVKIDRSFVEGIESGKTPISLLKGITSLCQTLGLQVTIEGVSSMAQLDAILATDGINRIQGFVLGPALPSSSIIELGQRILLPANESRVEEKRVAAN